MGIQNNLKIAYPGRVVLQLKYSQIKYKMLFISFYTFWKFLRFANSARSFLQVKFLSRDFFGF